MARIPHSSWRRVIAGVLAYALALQGFIFVLDIGRAAAAADGATVAGFALCTHSGAASAPGEPTRAPIGALHCPFCFAGAVFVNCAAPCVPPSNKVILSHAVWPITAPRLVALSINESAWPRGPPAAA